MLTEGEKALRIRSDRGAYEYDGYHGFESRAS